MIFGLFGGAKKRAAELYKAASEGNVDGVKQALDKGADINSLDPEFSETALHAAVDKSHVAVVEYLLSKGANPDIISNQHFSPLILATAMGDSSLPIVELLISSKASLTLAPSSGPNAGGAPVHIAASNGANAILMRLIAAGAPATILPSGNTLMHLVAIGGNAETVDIVSELGIPVDATENQSRTPLHLAALSGNSAVAKKLLELGASVDKKDSSGCTALMHAALQNKPDVVDQLLKNGANPDIVVETEDSALNPLYAASINGHDTVVKLLLASGASVTKKVGGLPPVIDMAQQAGHKKIVTMLKDALGQAKAAASAAKTEKQVDAMVSELEDALKQSDYAKVMPIKDSKNFGKLPVDWQLLVYALFGEEKAVKKALAAGANPNRRFDDIQNGIHPLFAAVCIAKDLPSVEALIAAGADVNLPRGDGLTVLMQAAKTGTRQMIERLLAAGADVNAIHPETGLGPFGMALNGLRMGIAKLILNNGAEPKFGSVDTLPLAVAEHGDIEMIKTIEARGGLLVPEQMKSRVAFVAARNKDGAVLDYLLEHGADVNHDNDFNYTPLTLAVLNNHIELVERYLARGDDPNVEDIDHETALSLAIEKNFPAVISLLRAYGAQENNYPGLTDEQAMLKAAEDGKLGTILRLRDAGVSINAEDNDGNTPLMLATKAGHLGVVRSLYHLGADINHRNKSGLSATSIAKEADNQLLLNTMKEFVAEDTVPEGMSNLMLGGIYEMGDTMFGRLSHPYKEKPPYDNSSDEDDEAKPSFADQLEELQSLLDNRQVAERLGKDGLENFKSMVARHIDFPEDAPEDDRNDIEKIIEFLRQLSEESNEEEEDSEEGNSESQLNEAIKLDDIQEARKLLKAGVNPNEPDEQGIMPLMMAVLAGSKEFVDLLVKNGAQIDWAMPDGKSALFLAVASGNDAMVPLLVKHGASVEERYSVEHNGVDVDGCSPLYVAATVGQLDICKQLIKLGADIECVNDAGINPLMASIQNGHEEIMKLLLKSGATVDPDLECMIDAPGFGRQSPLTIAVRTGNVPAVKALLSANADVNAPAGNGWTALKSASQEGNVEIVKLLLRAGADVNVADETNYTPLMNAVSQENEEIVKLLLKHGADPDIQGCESWPDDDEWDGGRTALMDAAFSGNIPIARELLKHGANPNLLNVKGRTALHSAVLSGDPAMVTLLLNAGADADAYGSDEETLSALDFAARRWAQASKEDRKHGLSAVLDMMLQKGMPTDLASLYSSWLELIMDGCFEVDDYLRKHGVTINPNQQINHASPLFLIAAGGDHCVEAGKWLLNMGADPNYVSPAGLPVLSLAVRNGALELTKALLKAGANVLARNRAGVTAYDLAVIYDHPDVISLLIQETNTKLSEQDKLDPDGNTLLMRAVKSSDIAAVKEALANGADASIRDLNGDTPLSFAICHELKDITSALRQSGADRKNTSAASNDEQMIAAAEAGALGTILDLLDAGVSINAQNSSGDSAFTAAETHPGVLRVLAKLGADLAHKNGDGKTAYMIAASANRSAVMKALEEVGAPMDEPAELDGLARLQAIMNQANSQYSSDGETDNSLDVEEFFSAVIYADANLVRKQLMAGIDPNVQNDEGRTALIFALSFLGRNEMGRREERDREQIVSMLIDAGADPDFGPLPPLMLATIGGRLHVVNSLIKSGADINATADLPADEDGGTANLNALMLALSSSEEDGSKVDERVTLALVDAGIDLAFKSDDGSMAVHAAANSGMLKTLNAIIRGLPECVDAQDGNGNTPLVVAASNNQVEAIDLLLGANADRNIRNLDGKTALDVASAEGKLEAAVALS